MSLTIGELASVVGKDENYVRQHVRRNLLTVRRDGRRILVEEAEAARWANERGLPFRQPVGTIDLAQGDSDRASRITVCAIRTHEGTLLNMFTLARHRDSRSLGPWATADNGEWFSETVEVEGSERIRGLEFYRLDTRLVESKAIAEGILHNSSLDIGNEKVIYNLARNPRRHWAYREHALSDSELFQSPFDRHSATMTEYWCFDLESRELWLETLDVAGEAVPKIDKLLHFPLSKRLDRIGNLALASAQDDIECEISATHGQKLILRVWGNDWVVPPVGVYSATVWACHSGHRVLQRSIEIRERETIIDCETATDLIGFAIYRNGDGHCIDQYEVPLLKSVSFNTVIAGPEIRMDIRTKRKTFPVGTNLSTTLERVTVEDSESPELDQGIRKKYLSHCVWRKDQEAPQAGDFIRFAPDQAGEAVAYVKHLLSQRDRAEGPIYFADPRFLGDYISDLELELLTSILSATRGRPLHILCGRRKESLSLAYPQFLTDKATVKRFTFRSDGLPAFHDRYLITPAAETLITNSVNGWGRHGVTFSTRPLGVYRAEAEKYWLSTSVHDQNDILAEEANPW
ncbi:MAG: hypothetical protein OXR67_15095 [Chloroflexota bacterium]|nr:hypothetical protein [Chloroflexota bacterium]